MIEFSFKAEILSSQFELKPNYEIEKLCNRISVLQAVRFAGTGRPLETPGNVVGLQSGELEESLLAWMSLGNVTMSLMQSSSLFGQ